MKYIELELGSHEILHGFDFNNKEIIEKVDVNEFTKKLVAIDQIKSISENAILCDYAFGRIIYWSYKGSMADIKRKLNEHII
jgi:hypothetical protein